MASYDADMPWRDLPCDPGGGLKYAEMEMTHKNVNHARNVWDRAVSLLPRVDQFWYKYIHMEEMMGQIANARAIFERWMDWEPDHNGTARPGYLALTPFPSPFQQQHLNESTCSLTLAP